MLDGSPEPRIAGDDSAANTWQQQYQQQHVQQCAGSTA
jgi:hypothetical protein